MNQKNANRQISARHSLVLHPDVDAARTVLVAETISSIGAARLLAA